MAQTTLGFVYVLTNPSMPEQVKIGMTTRLVEERAREIFTTGVPEGYEIAYRLLTSNPREVEQEAHRRLAKSRVNPRREFFRVPVERAKAVVDSSSAFVEGIQGYARRGPLRIQREDRITLSMQTGDLFFLISYDSIFAPKPKILDIWQSQSDGDRLEIYGSEPSYVAGLSDDDPGCEVDPTPFYGDGVDAAANVLYGRERLVPGDRLLWVGLANPGEEHPAITFDAQTHVQILARTRTPRTSPEGFPILLNALSYDPPKSMFVPMRKALEFSTPDVWAPRNPDPSDGWSAIASETQPPEYWIPALKAIKDTSEIR